MRAVLFVLALAIPAAAAPPKRCGVTFAIHTVTKGDVTDKIASIKPAALGVTVTLDKGLAFRYVADLPAPFATGDTIHVTYRCGGPPPGIYCDARIADATDRVLIVAAQNGSDDFSDGWSAKAGKILTSRQNPNEKQKSIEHGHELVLTRGKTSAAVTGDACTAISEGGATWYATGSAHSWEGMRPPEGIDYKTYSISRGN